MRRMMIIDDEPIILDGLYEFFMKVNFTDLEIIKVDSTVQAIEWLNTVKIDVVLSDICMPGMDGMGLISEIMDRWPRCKVILLTGHNEFDYAHQAIRNPCVVDYLLKTEGMDKIKSAVESALERIASEEEYNYQTHWVRDKLPRALPQLQQQLLLDILRRSEALDYKSLQDEFDAIHLSFQASQFVLPLMVKIEGWRNYDTPSDFTLLRYAVANISEELLSDKAIVRAIDLDSGTIACFLQPASASIPFTSELWMKTIRYAHGIMESLQQACDTWLHLSVSIIASELAVGWHELNATLNRLRMATYDRPGIGMEKLLTVNTLEQSEHDHVELNRYAVIEQLLTQMKQRLLEGDVDFGESFRKWIQIGGEDGPEDPFIRWRMLSGISNTLLEIVQQLGLMNQALNEKELSRVLQFNTTTPWSEVVSFYHSFWDWIIYKRSDHYKHDEANILAMIHHYIKQHLGDDLSLTSIARYVSLNPSYLSRWYKKVTGKGISDYISDKKLELSKELLLGTSLKMHEISNQLGFRDQHYFFRFFKKAMGSTPQEFRDQRRS